MDPQPVTLAGRHVRLEPISPVHAPDLLAAFLIDPSIWQWMPSAPPTTLEAMRALIAGDLEAQAQGNVIAFAQVAQATGRVIGHTTYMNISRADWGLEIGNTWIGKPWQRSGINTEAKYLLLRHAFEQLGAVRVQLKTDGRNRQSQTAIERLGAVREGVLRKHRRLWDGFIRDTVMYSILDTEWPTVKARLEAMGTSPA
jgi:RimJ/RimL family protein N-acetyltransferase